MPKKRHSYEYEYEYEYEHAYPTTPRGIQTPPLNKRLE